MKTLRPIEEVNEMERYLICKIDRMRAHVEKHQFEEASIEADALSVHCRDAHNYKWTDAPRTEITGSACGVRVD